jgi:hypothetical protein
MTVSLKFEIDAAFSRCNDGVNDNEKKPTDLFGRAFRWGQRRWFQVSINAVSGDAAAA